MFIYAMYKLSNKSQSFCNGIIPTDIINICREYLQEMANTRQKQLYMLVLECMRKGWWLQKELKKYSLVGGYEINSIREKEEFYYSYACDNAFMSQLIHSFA